MKTIPPDFIEYFDTNKFKFDRWRLRFEGALEIYDVKDEALRTKYLLHYIGAEAYDVVCDNLSPTLPQTKSYAELGEILNNFYMPKPLEIFEYYKFHTRNQNEGETVKEYEAILRKLAIHCGFGNFLITALRNQFVCGLRDDRIRNRLLEMADLTLNKALEVASAMEISSKDAQTLSKEPKLVGAIHSQIKKKVSTAYSRNLSKPDEGLNSNKDFKLNSKENKNCVKCYRCGGPHYANNCRHKSTVCSFCNYRGHIQK